MDNKKEINEKIAGLLGFKKEDDHWIYPPVWEEEKTSYPQRSIPDFVEMLRICRKIKEHFEYGLPRQ